MKFIVTLLVSALIWTGAFCQTDISNWSKETSDNISVERLAGDSLTTSFLIQIKEEVPCTTTPIIVNTFIF
ncbi:hypothetical protein O3Q51_06430 [Cryomorphaceae bacterium 1068]|nr:hypothetical protein [Cryomorphaceae bacterium 1068]